MAQLSNDVLIWLGIGLQSKDSNTQVTLDAQPKKSSPQQQIFAAIANVIQREQKLSLRNFGKFTVLKHPERRGRNPQTGDVIIIRASHTVRFTPASALQQFVTQQKNALAISIPQVLKSEFSALSHEDLHFFCKSMLLEIAQQLRSGQTVTVQNFGVFQIRKRQERVGRNPQTGAVIRIKAQTLVAFRAGSFLKKKIAE